MTTHSPEVLPQPPHDRREPVLLMLALAAWLGATLAFRALAMPDEGRYAGVAWEMVRSGHWLEPTLDGLPYFHKPPMWYWLSAAAMSVFGVHPWAARLPSLAGGVITGAGLFLFARRWGDAGLARTALVVFATMPLVYGAAQFANHDTLVAGFITCSIVLAAHAVLARDDGEAYRVPLALAYACAGFGVMTKGLIGAMLPGLVFTAWCLASGRRCALRMLVWPAGWALLLAIAVPWMALMERRHPGFLHYFLVVQHLYRYVGGGFNNPQGPWFYPAVLATLGLPWTPWLWPMARRCFWTGHRPRRDVRLLMAAWLAVVVVFFSLPRSKLVGYILPAAAPFALLAAEGLHAAWAAAPGRWVRLRPGLRSLAGFSGLVCVCAVAVVAHVGSGAGRPAVAAWRADIAPNDRVLMLDDYDYDLPLYLRLPDPVAVVTDWSRAERQDDWRRELHDAARFAPQAARDRLIDAGDLTAWLCRPGTTWIFGEEPALRSLGATQIHALARKESMAIWNVADGEAARAACRSRASAWAP